MLQAAPAAAIEYTPEPPGLQGVFSRGTAYARGAAGNYGFVFLGVKKKFLVQAVQGNIDGFVYVPVAKFSRCANIQYYGAIFQ